MSRVGTLLVVVALVLAGAVGPVGASQSTDGAGVQDVRTSDGSTASVAATATNNSTTLTLLSYNDVQTAAAEDTTLPRMVTLVNERRAAIDNPTVTVGGGDEVSPHALSPLSQWAVPVDVLNVLQPDAEVVGNHDLDYGFEAVDNFSAASEFPWLMANIVDSETGEPIPGTEPYTVVEKQGVRVGVVGLADEAIKSKTAVDFDEAGYELRNYSAVASEYATMLKEEQNVDVVVAAAHIGVPESKTLANTTDNVDVVVVGDDELEYPPQETSGTVIMEAEARAEHVAELNLTVENGEVTAWNGRLLDVTGDVPKNETASVIISTARENELNAVAGETEVELDARFSRNYHDETALGNMITDAFRAETGAEVAITNAGGIRSNSIYGPGNVTVGDVYNILPFQNTLVTVELTGAELKQLLASQVVTLESETGQLYGAEAQLQVSGVTYEWASHEGQEPAIREAWVNGEPVADDETYNVTVNSYMAGWDGSVLEDAPRVSTTNTLYGTALLEYVQNNSRVSPEDTNRIRRVDDFAEVRSVSVQEGSATVVLDAPAGANATVADSFYVTHADSTERIHAESVELGDGTLEVSFAMSDLAPHLGRNGDLELYGEYDSTAYDLVYFEHSVVNADLERGVFGQAADSGSSNGQGHGHSQVATTQGPLAAAGA
ncbi:bifunctional metallophosphatase/5'-nucleotidase [Halobacterium wangiae]|uniref:bifunctional metallophosphatase/5'-nucleotidase n=1 Tax=Halobacterium wangiae TaxID=2902623 RepID=UPI001E4B752D|nr:bifunctional UDP-sugar hydrolase/5'-nucleotidase [Halobacterium wangiae]